MSLIHTILPQPLRIRCFIVTFMLVSAGAATVSTAQTSPGLVVTLTSLPPFETIRPDMDLTQVTLTAFLAGKPLSQGRLRLRLTAPPQSQVFSTGFPWVEGTTLLECETHLRDGVWTFQYLFPIRGTYTLELDLTPIPGGPVFSRTTLQPTLTIKENPRVVLYASLLLLGLLVLGGITGRIFARSAAAREPPSGALLLGAGLWCVWTFMPAPLVWADSPPHEPAASATSVQQTVHGEPGWTLSIQASPTPATVGQLVDLTLMLHRDEQVFPWAVEMSLVAVHQEAGHTVLSTHLRTPQGRNVQRLQFYDGAPHTVTVTARPVGEAFQSVSTLTARLDLDVVARHPPVQVTVKTMALLLGVFMGGMAGGFFCPWFSRGRPDA